jgi:hypothetical protein
VPKLSAKALTGVPTHVAGKVPTALPTTITGKVPTTVPTTFATTTTVPVTKIAGHLPAAVSSKVPAPAASCLSKVPTGVPTSVPAPTGVPTSVPTPKVPGVSAPALPTLDCSQVPSAVKLGGPAEHSLALPSGLHFDAVRTQSHTFDGKKICEVAQTWKGRAGQWIKLERFKGEATLEQIRQAIRLPQAQPVSVGGTTLWESPLGSGQGSGVIWSPEPGVAMFVGASPAYRYQLEAIATRLQQIGG